MNEEMVRNGRSEDTVEREEANHRSCDDDEEEMMATSLGVVCNDSIETTTVPRRSLYLGLLSGLAAQLCTWGLAVAWTSFVPPQDFMNGTAASLLWSLVIFGFGLLFRERALSVIMLRNLEALPNGDSTRESLPNDGASPRDSIVPVVFDVYFTTGYIIGIGLTVISAECVLFAPVPLSHAMQGLGLFLALGTIALCMPTRNCCATDAKEDCNDRKVGSLVQSVQMQTTTGSRRDGRMEYFAMISMMSARPKWLLWSQHAATELEDAERTLPHACCQGGAGPANY